jgi:hypothetical protein
MVPPDDGFLAQLLLRADADVSGRDSYSPEDLGFWPAAEVDACQRAGLLVLGQPSAWVACPACLECGELEVEWRGELGDPRRYPYVVCPEFGPRRISREQMQRWRFSLAGLAVFLAGELGALRHQEIVANRVWSLGLVIVGGEQRDLCLGLGLGRSDGREIVGSVAKRATAPVAWLMVGPDTLPDGASVAGATLLADVLDSDGRHIRVSAALVDQPPGPALTLPAARRTPADPAPVSDEEIRQALASVGITSERQLEILKAYLATETVKGARTLVSVATATIDKRVSEIRVKLQKAYGADYAERIVPYRRPGLRKGR